MTSGQSKLDPIQLEPHKLYRVSRHLERPEIAGKVVTFHAIVWRYGRRWALVNLVEDDGGKGQEWLVSVNQLFNL